VPSELLKEKTKFLKKDILNLIVSVIKDVSTYTRLKKYTILLRLIKVLEFTSRSNILNSLNNSGKCKSLINDIELLLETIFGKSNGQGSIPNPLLLFTRFLPGTSPQRATINTIELLQKVGIPTGALPDGSPNLMGIYNLMTHRGADKEENENGKIEGVVIVPPATGGILRVFGKKI
jgi:hypothetical protein